MSTNSQFRVPTPVNEPVHSYAPGTPAREALVAKYNEMYAGHVDVPMFINGEEVRTGQTVNITPPHDRHHTIGAWHRGDKTHVQAAVDAALAARPAWGSLAWEQRAAIFLKVADLVSGPYRSTINAATMLAQSKTAHQAEIDAACEFADFLRFNVQYMTDLYAQQPDSLPGMWNRLEYRPLEGFVVAITPFNFTAIAGNLPAAPALMGNTVVWKPANTQVYSAHVLMNLFRMAGLPAGVINLVTVDGPGLGEVVFSHKDFAGLHFTGSTGVFRNLWKTISNNLDRYKSYPRIVGETGGKDFIVAHPSADVDAVVANALRGAFEFQGQKCSAASRAYVPRSLAAAFQEKLAAELATVRMGTPADLGNFFSAVIDERSFDKIADYIEAARQDPSCTILSGGTYDKSVGYFVAPTVVVTTNPKSKTMVEEIFGPVLTVYIYEDAAWEETLTLVDETSEYALTGAIFARDRYAIEHAMKRLENAAGNFYINDKPTGAVVGQQPFGGARGSGTNDKAGSYLNLIRWVSPRTIKETLVSPTDYRYPFLG
jgi:1-pyrroline-5-carboxylate dehydrogenase